MSGAAFLWEYSGTLVITSTILTIEPDELLVLYTDGVTEATNPNGEEFGRERLGAVGQGSAVI